MKKDIIIDIINNHEKTINMVKEKLISDIEHVANILFTALKNGNKILLCGNGGSAADCQHIAAEFVGRFQVERRGLPAIALTTDTSILTSIGNDYGFNFVFSRQVSALANEGDILIAFSTSGNSENVLEALKIAKDKNVYSIALTGYNGGKIKECADFCLNVPVDITARVQEAHILIGHILCELTDDLNYEK